MGFSLNFYFENERYDLDKVVARTDEDILFSLFNHEKDIGLRKVEEELRQVADRTEPMYLQKDDGIIRFRHRCIAQAVCLSFGDKMPKKSLKYFYLLVSILQLSYYQQSKLILVAFLNFFYI